jgi:hypothetical protein
MNHKRLGIKNLNDNKFDVTLESEWTLLYWWTELTIVLLVILRMGGVERLLPFLK